MCAALLLTAACGTSPETQKATSDSDLIAAEGAASADPNYRVKGVGRLLDFGIDLF